MADNDFARMVDRLGMARAEAKRLLSEVADADGGVWMRNLSTEMRVIVRHADTLARLISEGWVKGESPASAEPPKAAPAAQDVAPEPTPESEPEAPAPKGKKA